MKVIQKEYLPFSEEELASHFHNPEHLKDYLKSAQDYNEFLQTKDPNKVFAIQDVKYKCQIEKDETIWTASCFSTLCLRPSKKEDLKDLLIKAYGLKPPLKNFASWDDCLFPDFEVFFEVQVPSSPSYKEYVKKSVVTSLIIKYVKDSAEGKDNLEGPTHVDAIIVNKSNGFSVLVEAKVLSDISYQVTYDEKRNQIIRNLDVMLEPNPELQSPLHYRKPENSLFLLLTPRKFQDSKTKSRLYSYKYDEYKNTPQKIQDEMPHRKKLDYIYLSQRIGWITWEDFRDISRDYCRWLQ